LRKRGDPICFLGRGAASDSGFGRARSMLEKRYSATDEDGGDPATAIDTFLEEDACGNRVADEGQRSRGGRDQADIGMAQGKEEGKEADRHSGEAAEEARIAKHGKCRAKEA